MKERNNDDKEEFDFGDESSDKIRMLGCYMGFEEDVKQRTKRAGSAWVKVKNRLKGSKVSKKIQAQVVQACVESTLLFDSQARPWRIGEMKKLQQTVDKMYRYIWSRKTQPPLMQMQEEGKNMQDLRNEMKIKSVRWKIEKRQLERLGHVMRMEDDRMVKAAVLGWLEDLEQYDKVPGKKRKTVLYLKKLCREVGVDTTNIAALTKDRKAWKSLVRERMKHLEIWEKRGGNKIDEDRGVRNTVVEKDDNLWCGICNKTFATRTGLIIHRKRMHEISKEKVKFKCDDCEENFRFKGGLENHRGACAGAPASSHFMKKCRKCAREVSKSNWARHCNSCHREAQINVQQRGMGEKARCPWCQTYQSKANLSRHKKKCPFRIDAGVV